MGSHLLPSTNHADLGFNTLIAIQVFWPRNYYKPSPCILTSCCSRVHSSWRSIVRVSLARVRMAFFTQRHFFWVSSILPKICLLKITFSPKLLSFLSCVPNTESTDIFSGRDFPLYPLPGLLVLPRTYTKRSCVGIGYNHIRLYRCACALSLGYRWYRSIWKQWTRLWTIDTKMYVINTKMYVINTKMYVGIRFLMFDVAQAPFIQNITKVMDL